MFSFFWYSLNDKNGLHSVQRDQVSEIWAFLTIIGWEEGGESGKTNLIETQFLVC